MGDSGEGLVDAESRIQERMEELAQQEVRRTDSDKDRETERAIESLRLARTGLERQLNAGTPQGRRAQLSEAIADLNRRIAQIK